MTRQIRRTLCLILVLAGIAPAGAQTILPERLVTGFRSAHFGMTGDEVRQAVTRDFKPAAGAVTEQENQAEGTTAIVVRLPALEPGPGPAIVSYILGATSHRLSHINVTWTKTGNPTDAERAAFAVAGLQLANYFRSEGWKPGGSAAGIVEAPGTIALFAGVDAKGGAIEVAATGVAIQKNGIAEPTPTGPAQLRIAYDQNAAHPDILTVKPGSY